jgi:hypothetical protein
MTGSPEHWTSSLRVSDDAKITSLVSARDWVRPSSKSGNPPRIGRCCSATSSPGALSAGLQREGTRGRVLQMNTERGA